MAAHQVAYRKTALPAKLDLSKRNTREQLRHSTDDKRGLLDGVGLREKPSEASQRDCNDVMQKHLQAWLSERDITGPPPSPEAEQRAMWQWIRDFHKEYSDEWYTRNMPRLRDQFRPSFLKEMRRLRAQSGVPETLEGRGPRGMDLLDLSPQTSHQGYAPDLLELKESSTSPAHPLVPKEGFDLLDVL
mmetsp:Transcript_8636/g.20527  ORF Transcript_8636/g.20527 Transcript_8636/m.20527 type:complete len:188 (-) Transcript_8636:31-594(-)